MAHKARRAGIAADRDCEDSALLAEHIPARHHNFERKRNADQPQGQPTVAYQSLSQSAHSADAIEGA